jgi:hypothetical protein
MRQRSVDAVVDEKLCVSAVYSRIACCAHSETPLRTSGNIVRICARSMDLGPEEMKLLLLHEMVARGSIFRISVAVVNLSRYTFMMCAAAHCHCTRTMASHAGEEECQCLDLLRLCDAAKAHVLRSEVAPLNSFCSEIRAACASDCAVRWTR